MKKLLLSAALVLSSLFSTSYAQPFWAAVSNPCLSTGTNAMVVAKNGYLIATGCNPTRYSTNGGGSWGLCTGNSGDLSKFYVASNGDIFGCGNGCYLIKSTNNGVAWSLVCTHTFDDLATNSNGHMFGLEDGMLLKSIDNGITWDTINSSYTYPQAVSIAINSSNTIFLGTNWWGTGGQIYRSTDNGVNFTPMAGTTFSDVSINLIKIFGSDIYVGTQGLGMYRSSNNGVTWNPINTGITGTDNWISDFVFNSAGQVFASVSYMGVFMTIDKGNNWSNISSGLQTSGTTVRTPTTLAINASGTLYAGTNDFGTYRSTTTHADIKETAAENDAIIVFPNPAKDKITLVISTNTIPANCSVSIINTAGTTVKQLAIQAASTDINVQNLPQGNYIYQVQSDMGILKTGKIIIE